MLPVSIAPGRNAIMSYRFGERTAIQPITSGLIYHSWPVSAFQNGPIIPKVSRARFARIRNPRLFLKVNMWFICRTVSVWDSGVRFIKARTFGFYRLLSTPHSGVGTGKTALNGIYPENRNEKQRFTVPDNPVDNNHFL